MSQRDRIDTASRAPLEAFLERFPGGFNVVSDIVERRAAVTSLLAAQAATLPARELVVSEDRSIPGPPDGPPVTIRRYRPVGLDGPRPAIVFIHGGGMVFGSIEDEDPIAAMLCQAVPAVVVSVGYRLAPEHPYPAQLDDCYAALRWLADNAAELGVDPGRIALFGMSAGGALVVATAMRARDERGPTVRFQMAVAPMLDDRNETPSSREITDVGAWDRAGNLEAWGWYLGGQEADAYAAPARARELSGLPPAFIDVGEVDLFRDEDITFAQRLLAAGVPTELHVYPGAYHSSENLAPEAPLSNRIWETRLAVLDRALAPDER
ncbi:MAG: alpha/beta hydrolase [Nitriliruptoraceae bacterium]